MDMKKYFPRVTACLEKCGDIAAGRLGSAVCHLLLALTLAQGVIFSGLSPFGVAFVAASSAVTPAIRYIRLSRLNAMAALLGAAVGYAANDACDGLKYICASLLCYAAGSIFAESKAMRYAAFMPMMAVFALISTNLIYLVAGTVVPAALVLFAVEIILAGAAAWFYRFPLTLFPQPMPQESEGSEETEAELGNWAILSQKRNTPFTPFEKASVFTLLASVCAALSVWKLPFGMHAGRIAALACVLLFSSADTGLAAASGLCLGLALDLAGDKQPVSAACLGLAGLFAALFRRFGTLPRIIAYVVGYAMTLPWLYTESFHAGYLYDAFFVSVVCYLFGEKLEPLAARLLQPSAPLYTPPELDTEPLSDVWNADMGYLRRKLSMLSSAFSNLRETLIPGVEETGQGDDPSLLFESAAMRVCKKCERSHICWNGEDSITKTAFNDATGAIRKRGRAVSADFPPYFAARCIRFPEFLTAVNEAIAVSAYRKRFKRRIYDDVRLLCAQYEGMSGVLRDVSADLTEVPHIDRRLSACLSEELRTVYAGDCTLTALQGAEGRLRIDIETDDPIALQSALPALLPAFDRITDRRMTTHGTRAMGADLTCLTLIQKEAFRARIGVGIRSRRGEAESGDTCAHFKTDDGKLCLIISDGMGSGADAAAVSGSAARLLEGFLRSGISVQTALRLICPAFALKHDSETFTTIDLACIDLHTGNGAFYKCGAAPSFILTEENGLRRITSGTLPAGVFVGDAMSADKTTVSLHDGDTVVMMSDGIADSGKESSDASFLRMLTEHRDETPSELASMLLDTCEGEDDATVFVVRLERTDG